MNLNVNVKGAICEAGPSIEATSKTSYQAPNPSAMEAVNEAINATIKGFNSADQGPNSPVTPRTGGLAWDHRGRRASWWLGWSPNQKEEQDLRGCIIILDDGLLHVPKVVSLPRHVVARLGTKPSHAGTTLLVQRVISVDFYSMQEETGEKMSAAILVEGWFRIHNSTDDLFEERTATDCESRTKRSASDRLSTVAPVVC